MGRAGASKTAAIRPRGKNPTVTSKKDGPGHDPEWRRLGGGFDAARTQTGQRVWT